MRTNHHVGPFNSKGLEPATALEFSHYFLMVSRQVGGYSLTIKNDAYFFLFTFFSEEVETMRETENKYDAESEYI